MATGHFVTAVRQFSSSAARLGQLVQAPIQVYGIEGRYATALYSAATKEKKLDVIEKDIKKIQQPLSRKFTDVVTSSLKKQNCDALTVNTFGAMAENGRMPRMQGILRTYVQLMSAHRGEVPASVTTAKPLDAAQQKEVEAILKMFLKQGQSLYIETKVDPSLIGGMVVSIGDKYIDMSISNKVNTYTSLLRQAA